MVNLDPSSRPPAGGTIWPAWLGLGLVTLLRLGVAASTPLSPDEAYYWVWAQAPAASYLDHPPMVALCIGVGTLLGGDSALGVRLLGPLLAAAGSLLLADAGRVLFPGRGAGLWAAVLLNATLLLGAGAVTMTPDTPLLFFWTACLWALARLAAGGGGGWWLLAGLAAGLGGDSKYTAVLLGPGALLWAAGPGTRRHLATPWPWAGGLVAAATLAPVLWWNAAHGWVSLIRQGGRAGDWSPGRAAQFLAELVGGQIGLATPILFALFVLGTAAAAARWRAPSWRLPAALVLPGALVFLQHALGDRVQANWAAILYPGAALAAAARLTLGRGAGREAGAPAAPAPANLIEADLIEVGRSGAGRSGRGWTGCGWTGCGWIRAGRIGAALGAAITALVYLQASLAPLALPPALDPTLRLAGWDGLARQASVLARTQGAGFVASEEYGAAALLAWHGPFPAVGAEPRWRLFNLPPAPRGTGLLLISARRREGPDPAFWTRASPVGELVRQRDGLAAERFRAWRVELREGTGAVLLPRRARD